MKRITFSLLALLLSCSVVISQNVIIKGSNGIADNTSYTSLKAAFDALNLVADQTGKDIEIQIAASTSESVAAVLNQPATASWNSLTIYPTVAGVSITGNLATPLIDLNGADKVTISGYLNNSGSIADVKSMTIENQNSTTTSNTSTIRIYNDACNNTVTGLILKGSANNTASGIIFVAAATAPSTATGNDNITVTYNDFTRSGSSSPTHGVYNNVTAGLATAKNDYITVSNNNFYGLFQGAITTYAVRTNSYSSNAKVINNNFYEPTTVVSTGTNTYYPIYIGGDGPNIVKYNFIGGSAPRCAGLPMTKTNAFGNAFNGITVSGGTVAANDSIEGNVIRNIIWTNTAAAKDFKAFYLLSYSNINFGMTAPNIVRNINYSCGSTTTTAANFYGVQIATTTTFTKVNQTVIDSITVNTLTGSTQDNRVCGIYNGSNACNFIITNNVIGQNYITVNNATTGTPSATAGIYMSNTATVQQPAAITGNVIMNITNNDNNVNAATYGIFWGGTNTSGVIANNYINNIIAGTTANPSKVVGIQTDLSSLTIPMNVYNNIIALTSNNPSVVYGMVQGVGVQKFYHNTVAIGGAPTSGAYESAALFVPATSVTVGREIRNNVFANGRINAGATGINYAAKMVNTTGLTINNNNYASMNVLGSFNAVDKTNLADWKVATAQDAASVDMDPAFQTSATGLDYFKATAQMDGAYGIIGAGTTDFAGVSRTYVPQMGAFEYPNAKLGYVANLSSLNYDLATSTGPSASQNFIVYSANLTSDVSLTPSENFEVSLNNTDFTASPSSLTLTKNTVQSPVYVRLKSGLAVNDYTGQIALASGSLNPSVSLVGKVTDTTTGLNGTTKNLRIVALNGSIVITGAAVGSPIEVYNSVGNKVVSVQAVDGTTMVPVSAKGVVLVKVGVKLAKLVL